VAKIEPWDKAAECERALRRASDPRTRAILAELRDLWIALGNESAFLSPNELKVEIEALARVCKELIDSDEVAIH
jgi:hypothetical protein